MLGDKAPMFRKSFRIASNVSEHYRRIKRIYWCPRTESNRYLMITNQLHDLHATGASRNGNGL
jgi:hypothetical protein